jgi:hypothetical protein
MQYKTVFWMILCFICVIFCACAFAPRNQSYAVLLGLNPEDAEILTRYQTVVIDAQYFTKDEIAAVRRKGTKVYTYLNIGSIETFREGYEELQDCILSPYDNWPGEYWVDVSRESWQNFVATEAKSLAEKGVDGFFLDNADVYYLYPQDAIYKGLNAILQNLAQYEKPVLINGGDVFVTKAVLEASEPNPVITGVNQECVLTNIDFATGALVRQDTENSSYYQAHLEKCKAAGLTVYLTEYADANSPLNKKIATYCEQNGFLYYISPSINLDAK